MQPVRIDVRVARQEWRDFRVANGWGPNAPLLTPPKANHKFDLDGSVFTYGLALAQSNTAGKVLALDHIAKDGRPRFTIISVNVCPFSTPACREGCVAKNGNGAYKGVQSARALKVKFLLANPNAFLTLLAHEIDKAYKKHGDRLRVRLNTFSDIRWEEVAPWLLDRPVSFYDYTKDWERRTPTNYRLIRSVSEQTPDAKAACIVASTGTNIAVVFSTKKKQALPERWHGIRVIDGDKSDNRFDDPSGVVVGLRAKGRMRKDTRGMVRVA